LISNINSGGGSEVSEKDYTRYFKKIERNTRPGRIKENKGIDFRQLSYRERYLN